MKLKRPFWQSEDNPINCRQLGPVLQAYLDGEVDTSDIPLIEAHLEACRDCGLEAETYTAIKRTLSQRQTDVPSEVLERLRQFSTTLPAQISEQAANES